MQRSPCFHWWVWRVCFQSTQLTNLRSTAKSCASHGLRSCLDSRRYTFLYDHALTQTRAFEFIKLGREDCTIEVFVGTGFVKTSRPVHESFRDSHFFHLWFFNNVSHDKSGCRNSWARQPYWASQLYWASQRCGLLHEGIVFIEAALDLLAGPLWLIHVKAGKNILFSLSSTCTRLLCFKEGG